MVRVRRCRRPQQPTYRLLALLADEEVHVVEPVAVLAVRPVGGVLHVAEAVVRVAHPEGRAVVQTREVVGALRKVLLRAVDAVGCVGVCFLPRSVGAALRVDAGYAVARAAARAHSLDRSLDHASLPVVAPALDKSRRPDVQEAVLDLVAPAARERFRDLEGGRRLESGV